MDGAVVRTFWTVECCFNRKWLPLHGESGLDRFESKETATARAKELKQLNFS